MDHADRRDPFAELKADAEGYRVFGEGYESIGRVGDLFVDEDDRPLYIGVNKGLLDPGLNLVPVEVLRVNDRRRVIEVAESATRIKNAPSLGEGAQLTPEREEEVRVYYGLSAPRASAHRDPSGRPAGDPIPDGRVDLVPGERKGSHASGTPRRSDPPLPGPVSSDTAPGKEWARGTEGHRSEPEERVGGDRSGTRRTGIRRPRR